MPFLAHRAGPSLDFLHFNCVRILKFYHQGRTYVQGLSLMSIAPFPVAPVSELSTLAI